MSTTSSISAELRAEVLVEAIPFLQRFSGRPMVVKYGGNAIAGADETSAMASFASDVAALRAVGLRPVVVHGGGPQIGDLMQRLGKEPEFRDGLRVTDEETLEIARMVLVGRVNGDLVSAINQHGQRAVGLSGEDAGLIAATRREPDIGFVGDISSIDPSILEVLLEEGLVPVIATIGSDRAGQAYNINADTVAGAIAEALSAEKLIFLSDVAGIRRDRNDASSVASRLSAKELDELIEDGTVNAGMIPKAAACAKAVRSGVTSAHIVDGRVAHALLVELFSEAGIGTMVVES